MSLDSSPLTLNSSPQASYCGISADTAKPIPGEASMLNKLTSDLTLSLRRPGLRTLTLIDKALSYLMPFESAKASVSSPAERRELLDLIAAHRLILSPYVDVDRVEWNLRRS